MNKISNHKSECRADEYLWKSMKMWRKGNIQHNNNETEVIVLKELMENEAFCNGVAVGINLHQQKVITASERKEPLKIGEELYYVQNGRERLQETIEKICEQQEIV